MAEEKETKEQTPAEGAGDDAAQGGDATPAEARPGGTKGLRARLSSPVVKIVLFVVMLAAMGGGSFLLVQNVIRPKVAPDETVTADEPPPVPEPGELLVIEDLLVNPAGTRASRFLRVAAALEFPAGEAELGAELERRRHQFRDLFITEFSSRTLDELVDAKVKEEIREELLARLNESISGGKLTNLYFTEYVIQ